MVGLNPGNGDLLWTFPLPKPQLTNAVTPLALAKGHVLVAGQGSEGTRHLQVEPHGSTWQVTEVWKSKPSPFYCNWLVDDSTGQLFGLHSNVLLGVDLDSGKTKWKQRAGPMPILLWLASRLLAFAAMDCWPFRNSHNKVSRSSLVRAY